MDCLLCHGKIPRWRRLKTGSQFCSDEHAEEHKKETVNRLLEYSDTQPASGAEDPIHRLALIGSETPFEEHPGAKWQLTPFTTLEVRRHVPAVANRLAALEYFLISPRLPDALVLLALELWRETTPARSAAPAQGAESRTSLPEVGLAEPVWIDPRLLDAGISSGVTPAALALWPWLPKGPSVGLRSLSPLAPAGIAARTRFLAGFDIGVRGGTGHVKSLHPDVPLSCWAPSGGMIAVAHHSPAVIPGRGSALGAAQGGQFLPMMAQAALHAAPASATGAGLQSVVASTPRIVPVRFEASALASGRKQPARFCTVPSDSRAFAAQPWRAVMAALGPDHARRVEWTPVLPECRKIDNLPEASRRGLLPISTPLWIAAPAPGMWTKRASPIAAELGFKLHAAQAPAFLRQALPPVRLRGALRPASPLLVPCHLATIAARGLKSSLDLQSPVLAACLPGTPRRFRGVVAAPHVSGALAASAVAAAPRHNALGAFTLRGPVPRVPGVHSRLTPRRMVPSPAPGPAESPSSRITAELAPWQPLEPHQNWPQATALHAGAELVALLSQAHLPARSGLATLSGESTPSPITARLAVGQPLEPCETRPEGVALRAGAEPVALLSQAHLPVRSGLATLSAESTASRIAARLAVGQPLEPCESRPRAAALRADAEPLTSPSQPHLPPAADLAAVSAGSSAGTVPAVLDAATAVAEWRPVQSRAATARPAASLWGAREPVAPSISPAPRGPASLSPGHIPPADAFLEAQANFTASEGIRERCDMLAPLPTPKHPAIAARPTGMVPPAGLRNNIEARAKLQPAKPLRDLAAFAPEIWPFGPIAPAPILAWRPEPRRPKYRDPADYTVHHAAEQAGRRVINWRGLGEIASYCWHEVLKPALSTQRGQRIVAAVCVLILVPLSLHLAHSSAMLASLGRPLQERSYYIQEEYFEGGAKNWSSAATLTRRDDSLAEINDGVTLYQPSMHLVDYTFTFAGEIHRGSLGWVVRAADPKNFYAFKLTRTGKGKDRKGTLERYAVINGSPEKALYAALPFELEDNRLYHVTMRANGDRITTMIEDRGVDSFADSRLRTGGVGFFADAGETGLVQSLSVSGNDDSEGRTIYWLISFWRSLTGLF